MVIANLLIEYIGYDCFQKAIVQTSPKYVSCIIQINMEDSWVSDSPYLHAFDGNFARDCVKCPENRMNSGVQGISEMYKTVVFFLGILSL